MIARQVKRVVLSALFAGGAAVAAFAHMPSDPEAVKDLGRLASKANLIIQTKVTDVTYRTSAPGANGARGVPYSFVTFSISKVVQGTTRSRSLTLRFMGGPDGSGGFLSVEGVPTFQVGDQDILFVEDNGQTSVCGLVECEFGRFRVVDGGVYAAHGEPLLGVAGGKLTAGNGIGPDELHVMRFPTPSFDAMMQNPAFAASVQNSGRAADARSLYEAGAPAHIELREVPSGGINGRVDPGSRAVAEVSVDQFLSSLSEAAAANPARSLQAVSSAAVNAPMATPQARAVAPPRGSGAGVSESPGPTITKN